MGSLGMFMARRYFAICTSTLPPLPLFVISSMSASIESWRAGSAKIMGTEVRLAGDDGTQASGHFLTCLLASEDYEAISKKYMMGSLGDMFILCTNEIGVRAGRG